MTDVTQGADALDDAALFREATDSPTLEQFENPKVEAPAEKPAETTPPEVRPESRPADEPAIPAGRLREENEARRRAERERDELATRLAALSRPQQAQQPQQKPDVFDNPSAFVQSEVQPLIDNFRQEMQMQREAYSMDMAVSRFGPETVVHSRQVLEQQMSRGDPMAWATYNRAMQSHDPYGVIAGWFHERQTLHEVGGDLKAYRQKLLDEAMTDPEYRKRVIESAKTNAAANGSFANRPPANSSIPKMPSLGNIGAAGGDTQAVEPSDLELFRAATTAKRR